MRREKHRICLSVRRRLQNQSWWRQVFWLTPYFDCLPVWIFQQWHNVQNIEDYSSGNCCRFSRHSLL